MNKILPILFLLVCFGVGFWRGVQPQMVEKLKIVSAQKIRLFHDPDFIFTDELKKAIKVETGEDFEITQDQKNADIIIAKFNSNAVIQNQTEPKLDQLLSKLISTDILNTTMIESHQYPILWRINNESNKIEIEVIFVQRNTPSINRVLTAFFNRDIQLKILKGSDWKTTLQSFEDRNIEPEKKASFLRKLQLNKIIESRY